MADNLVTLRNNLISPVNDSSIAQNSQLTSPDDQAYQVREVKVKIVENVLDHDFPQAKLTWQALEEAGIEPGDLVANALNIGHNYEVTEHTLNGAFQNPSDPNLKGESQVSETILVSYQYQPSKTLQNLLSLPEGDTVSLTIASNDLELISSDIVKEDRVKMVAIKRKEIGKLSLIEE